MNRSVYNRKHYRDNKPHIQSRRARRYREDAEYRESIIRASTLRRVLQSVSRRQRLKECLHNGVRERGYSLLEMSQIIGIDDSTIYAWCYKGVLPRNLYWTPSRHERMYSYSQMMFLKDLLEWYASSEEVCTGGQINAILTRVWKATFDSRKLLSSIALEIGRAVHEGEGEQDRSDKKDRKAGKSR